MCLFVICYVGVGSGVKLMLINLIVCYVYAVYVYLTRGIHVFDAR